MKLQNRKIGDELHGFKLVEIEKLSEYEGYGLLFRHEATAMEVYHVLNEDKELFFSYIFETIPSDNTGVAHIIEHSVLAGSKKYPIRDPFMQLQKGSACTFMNALTYPTKTLYPAASPLVKDFDNIFSVYTDAVFSPLLREETFMQEGIRLHCNEDGDFAYKGVVFNEMLGDRNDGEYVANNLCLRNLFPDTAYYFASGGDPLDIVDLDYKKFKSFYMQYYHPTNSKLFLYGNLDIEKYLELLNKEYLAECAKINVSKENLIPKKWDEPRTLSINCPSSDSDSGSIVATSFVTTDSSNPLEVITLSFIYELLLGSSGCPLYKAMIDSKLGDDVSNISGISTDYTMMPITIAFSGVKDKDPQQIEKFILKQLGKIADNGFDQELVAATFKRLSFQIHEKPSSGPMGLIVLKRALRGWLRGLSPTSTVEYSKAVDQLKLRMKDNPRYLEDWLNINVVNNNHRLLFVANPDSNAMDIYNEKLAKKIKSKTDRLEDNDKSFYKEKTSTFLEFQNKGDSQTDLQKVPKLTIEDLPNDIRCYDHEKILINSVPVYIMKEATNSIAYFDFFIHLEDLTQREIILLPLYTKILETCAVGEMDNTKVMTEIMHNTGGFNISLEGGSNTDLQRCLGIIIRVKMLKEDIKNGIELTKRIIQESHLDDYQNIWNSIVELKNMYKSVAAGSGYRFATIAASSAYSENAQLIEELLGISQWLFLDSIAREEVSTIAKELENLKSKINNLLRFDIHLTCDEDLINPSCKTLEAFLSQFEKQEEIQAKITTNNFNKDSVIKERKGFILPSSVNHTSFVLPSKPLGSKENAVQRILSSILSGNDLWNEVRVLGGAYGVDCHVESLEQLFIFISASDPNLSLTFDNFKKALEKYCEVKVDRLYIEDAIISNVANDLKPYGPDKTSIIDFRRILYKITDEMRKSARDAILSVDSESIKEQAISLNREENYSLAFFCDKTTFDKEKELLKMEEDKLVNLPV
ncbi:MAG: insulinase family protein [Sphaerochaetaceae bacterium]|nr:insulinase family protein [Sphaerochaetaceae bacterium]MDC7238596.1 insulinase family protein [Sphaerochaetaceae bacterium]